MSLFSLLQDCFEALSHGSFPPSDLLKQTISKGLGFAIIAAACVVKVPQILKISQNQSAQGLSLLSFELEQLALTIHGSYGFILGLPFSAYGEAVVLVLQNSFLLAQIYVLSKTSFWRPFLAISLFGTALAFISAGMVTPSLIMILYDLNNSIVLAARLPQIYQNFMNKSTGQLSGTVYVANFLGCIARIFTSLQEGGGYAMVRGFLLGLLLNGTLVSQVLLYRGSKAIPGKKLE
ncbi:mannose-P-dolichol utilization defect 1 protein [Coccomyxa subellipsoidea C-169]|uniref:Mannose-P-dolichol utilization defect 1 protein homolog n=1 Tax=Coccomyxa subellipsoidea (strain C-169) TaxID=574566 RepID=I0YS07_COCSC|nr:mannose-P-dolichol utilization defect 1 protein [Coccomyxa subellipsoidea C-169]EIE21176.1 mannose-P-dolichol utilization defect 1 protein [Coccomyxa subellipsoidea C-169]|eukprot:XP_005645720.1 mannose-P-dolichol utilization defect 1 protein [Coccomyxa subellipsoidea C-169]